MMRTLDKRLSLAPSIPTAAETTRATAAEAANTAAIALGTPKAALKSAVAGATDFASLQTAIAAL